MANKKIGLDIAINGESQYRQALQALNKELKTLGTEAKKLQAVYAEDANSYDALLAKSKNLGARYDEITNKTDELRKAITASQEAQAKWSERQSALGARLEELRKITAGTAEEQEKLNKKIAAAESTLKRHGENIEYAARREKDYTQELNLAEAEQAKVSRELDKTNKYLQEAATSFDGTAHSIDRYGNEVKDAAEDTRSFSDAADLLAKAIVASGAIEGAERLRDAIVATAKSSIEYESAFAGVRKTVDGTAEELAEISDGLREMSNEIPIAAAELAGIAENAGQLGISTGGIIGFTEVMAQLGVTTNLSAEEAASSLAKFANVTKMSESQYSNLGSSIVALGNNFATTEADIVAMATRLASTGEVVGLTEPQILAVATALSSVGIEAEAGGSAFSKLLKTIETAVESGSDSVQQYADIAGKSVEEFSAAWREDAVSALSDFIDGLGRLESEGTSTVTVLNDLGLTEVRLSNAVLALASSEGILSEALELSNTAWAENTALAEEAAVRFETTESKLQLLENAFENLKITVGDEFVGTFGGAIEGLTELTQAADEYVRANPDVVAGLTAVAAGIGGLAVAGTVIPLITTLWGLLAANPVGLVVTAIVGLTTALITYNALLPDTVTQVTEVENSLNRLAEQFDETRSNVLNLKSAYEEQTEAVRTEQAELERAIAKVEELGGKTELTASENEELRRSMDKLNGAIPGLRLNYDNLNDSLEDTVYHLRLVAQAQALVDEAVAKSQLKEALESNYESLDKNIEDAKRSLDDATEALETYKKLRDEYTAPSAVSSGRARGMGDDYNPYDDEVKRLTEAKEKADAYYISAIGAREANKREIIELTTEISNLDTEYAKKAEEIKAANTELFAGAEESAGDLSDTFTEATDTITEAADNTAAAVSKAAAATKTAVDSAGQSIIDHADTVQANLDALTKEYDSAYKSAQSTLGGIGGLFGELAFESDKSISDMLTGLDSQADFFTGYMLNIQRASKIGIDEGLVASLADGSKLSAGYLQVIVDEFNKVAAKYGENSEEAQAFVDDFNTKFEATSKAKDALAATMAGIQTNFEERASDILSQADDLVTELGSYSGNAYDKVAEAVSETLTRIAEGFTKFQVAAQEKSQGVIDAANYIKTGINTTLEVLPEEMKVAGQNVSLGLSEGILDKLDDVKKTVRRLAQEAILNTAKEELGIHSPSEEFKIIGRYSMEGYNEGITDNMYIVINGMLYAINKLESQTQSAAAAAGKALGDTMAKSMADALKAGQALRQAVESGNLTVDGKVVQTAGSVGIPSLSGQAALDWNAEQKRDFGLPDDWSNQDIVDWLNAGGAQSGGYSSDTAAKIEQAIKSENTVKQSLTQTTNKAWHDSYLNQLNANKQSGNTGKSTDGATVVVNQEIHSQLTPYELQTMSEKGVIMALSRV